MGKELNLLKFIGDNRDNWKKLLSNNPYNISIKEDNDYIIFNYSIQSDMRLRICQECRGIILNKNFKVVCYPFNKFFNYGEMEEQDRIKINLKTARIIEKVDGSIIKLWYDKDEWHVSTMATINAKNAELAGNLFYKNFYDLFIEGCRLQNFNFHDLNKNFTYIFELTSQYNRVVVPHKEICIYHIGTRDNISYEELDVDIGVKKPKYFKINIYSIEDIMQRTKQLPYDEEGYVIVDDEWNRVKVKSPAYVAAHQLANNGVITTKRMINIIRNGEDGEFLTYFPEFKDNYLVVRRAMIFFALDLERDLKIAMYLINRYKSRKEYAMEQRGYELVCKDIMFKYYDYYQEISHESYEKICEINKIFIRNYIKTMSLNKYVEYVEKIVKEINEKSRINH